MDLLQWVVAAFFGSTELILGGLWAITIAVATWYRSRARKAQKELQDEKAATAAYERVLNVDRHRDASDDAIRNKLRDYSKRRGRK
jgi:type VI protein secretion system component VasK